MHSQQLQVQQTKLPLATSYATLTNISYMSPSRHITLEKQKEIKFKIKQLKFGPQPSIPHNAILLNFQWCLYIHVRDSEERKILQSFVNCLVV